MGLKDWFNSQPYSMKGAVLGTLISFTLGTLGIILFLPCHDSIGCLFYLMPLYFTIPLVRLVLGQSVLDGGGLFIVLIINTIFWLGIGSLIGGLFGKKFKDEKNSLGFIKKYKLGAILGGLYGLFGDSRYVLFFHNFLNDLIKYIYLIKNPTKITFIIVASVFGRSLITLIVNMILWMYIIAYIQKTIMNKFLAGNLKQSK